MTVEERGKEKRESQKDERENINEKRKENPQFLLVGSHELLLMCRLRPQRDVRII